jgi:SAM-dependent methyltransferase/uncharacterized protein YbaR (Trm112 family)
VIELTALDRRYLEYLVCPADGASLEFDGRALVSAAGRRYPVVDGIPVMLRDDVIQTIDLAWESLAVAKRWEPTRGGDGLFVETLGIPGEERLRLKESLASKAPAVDPVVSALVASTNGRAYRRIVGRLDRYPIPELRLSGGCSPLFLDLGCSWGRWCLAAARKGYRAVGIDPSLGAVMAARRVAASMGYDNLYVVGDARYLPFRSALFDAVFSYSVLQHMARENVELALEQVARILKPGGVSLIQMAAWSGLRSLTHLVKRRFREARSFEVRYWSVGDMQRAFDDRIGPSVISVDCFFGLGLQYSDRELMTVLPRIATIVSEGLRRVSEHISGLRFVADSIYVTSVKPAPHPPNDAQL